MTELNFKVGDRWLTRSNRTVKIVAVVPELSQPIIGLCEGSAGGVISWHANGSFVESSIDSLDLISKLPNARRVYHVMVQDDDGIRPSQYCYATLEEARARFAPNFKVLCLIEPGFPIPVED